MNGREVSMKLRRRQLLLGGVAAGIVTTVGNEYATRRAAQVRSAEILAQNASDPTRLLQKTFEADAQKINAGLAIQASLKQPRPTISYSREMSSLLIQCSKLATQQYLTGKTIATYDGSIRLLPAYFRELDGYTQLASFKGHEAVVEDTLEVDVPTSAQNNTQDPLEQQANDAQNTVGQTVEEAVQLRQLTQVYLGFVLVSKTRNIIVFRGTQRNTEWLYRLKPKKRPPISKILLVGGATRMPVFRQFVRNMTGIEPDPSLVDPDLVSQLDLPDLTPKLD